MEFELFSKTVTWQQQQNQLKREEKKNVWKDAKDGTFFFQMSFQNIYNKKSLVIQNWELQTLKRPETLYASETKTLINNGLIEKLEKKEKPLRNSWPKLSGLRKKINHCTRK